MKQTRGAAKRTVLTSALLLALGQPAYAQSTAPAAEAGADAQADAPAQAGQ